MSNPNNIIIPSDPKTKQKIRNAATQISDAMTRIKSENDHIAAILAEMKDKTDVPSAMIKKLGATFYKQDLVKQTTTFEDFEALYETVMVTENETQAVS